VIEPLARFLPAPTVEFDGSRYFLDWDRPDSIGKVAHFYGCAANAVRAYMWVKSLGAEGLREVARIAVLNNNYLMKKVLRLRGASAPYAPGRPRIEQVRYSWDQLVHDTGVTSQDVGMRTSDYGVHYWTSHHPFVVPSPFTLEPTESYTQRELDEYADILEHVVEEAYTEPEIVKTAPHKSSIHRVRQEVLKDPAQWAMTWRAYRRKVDAG
jgi:glycine dehydrogenase subunit 2